MNSVRKVKKKKKSEFALVWREIILTGTLLVHSFLSLHLMLFLNTLYSQDGIQLCHSFPQLLRQPFLEQQRSLSLRYDNFSDLY